MREQRVATAESGGLSKPKGAGWRRFVSVGPKSEQQLRTLLSRTFTWKFRILVIVLTLVYLQALNFVYSEVISPRYAYSGLHLEDLTGWNYLFCIGCAIVCGFFLPISVARPSAGILSFLYLTVVLPSFIIPFHLAGKDRVSPEPLVIAMAVNFILLCWLSSRKPIRFKAYVGGQNIAIALLLVVGLSTLVLRLLLFRDLNLDFNLYDVYERRLQGRQIAGDGSIVAYVLNVGTSGIGLLMVGVGIARRYYSLFGFGLVLYMLAFLTVGTKDAIFIPILVIAMMVILTSRPRWFIPAIIVGLIGLCWASYFEAIYRGTYELSSILVRRQLIFPAAGNFSYWMYFSHNPLYYWTDSFLRFFVDSPYPMSKSFWMGHLSGRENIRANANIWGSAYADAGYLGMAIVSIAVSYLCRILDGLSSRQSLVLGLLIAFGLAAKLSNTGLERVLFTHGGIAVLFFLYLLQPGEQKKGLGLEAKGSMPLANGNAPTTKI